MILPGFFGPACVGIFVIAYMLVVMEERLHLKKSIPVMAAAGLIWMGVGFAGREHPAVVEELLKHNLLEFAELFLFLLAAITYVNTLEERQVFDALRGLLVRKRLSKRGLFWVTGGLAFAMSPVADNLTTTLVMGAVAIAVAGNDTRFISAACVNIVVAANAGGAFSPFGDITTLMVWQKGVVSFGEFGRLFLPSLVSWVVPGILMSWRLPKQLAEQDERMVELRPGAKVIIALFLTTIFGTVLGHQLLHLPPCVMMMMGLAVLKSYAHWLAGRTSSSDEAEDELLAGFEHRPDPEDRFDIFGIMARVEWDTMMFFYGVMLCVGGLAAFGYLETVGQATYGALGSTGANVCVGLASAVIDNIPVMFAVLTMNPEMSQNQWLLVTLTAGIGGSLLSVGSAAGVALMGQAKGAYTFMSHLKWSWAVGLGFAAGVGTHLLVNGR